MPQFRRQGDVISGIDAHGNTVVRVPVNEPVHVRPAYDRLYQIQRTNCP